MVTSLKHVSLFLAVAYLVRSTIGLLTAAVLLNAVVDAVLLNAAFPVDPILKNAEVGLDGVFLHLLGEPGDNSVRGKDGDSVRILEDRGDSWRVFWQGHDLRTGTQKSGSQWFVKKHHVKSAVRVAEAKVPPPPAPFVQQMGRAGEELQRCGALLRASPATGHFDTIASAVSDWNGYYGEGFHQGGLDWPKCPLWNPGISFNAIRFGEGCFLHQLEERVLMQNEPSLTVMIFTGSNPGSAEFLDSFLRDDTLDPSCTKRGSSGWSKPRPPQNDARQKNRASKVKMVVAAFLSEDRKSCAKYTAGQGPHAGGLVHLDNDVETVSPGALQNALARQGASDLLGTVDIVVTQQMFCRCFGSNNPVCGRFKVDGDCNSIGALQSLLKVGGVQLHASNHDFDHGVSLEVEPFQQFAEKTGSRVAILEFSTDSSNTHSYFGAAGVKKMDRTEIVWVL